MQLSFIRTNIIRLYISEKEIAGYHKEHGYRHTDNIIPSHRDYSKSIHSRILMNE